LQKKKLPAAQHKPPDFQKSITNFIIYFYWTTASVWPNKILLPKQRKIKLTFKLHILFSHCELRRPKEGLITYKNFE
jgi:hypothetical protein